MSSMWRNEAQRAAVLAQAARNGMMPEAKETTYTVPVKGFKIGEAPTAPVPLEFKLPASVTRAKQPNKTEAAFGKILEARQARGELIYGKRIKTIRYEGLSLRWGFTETAPPMVYTPDWVVTLADNSVVCFEVKGGHIFDRDIVRFKGCRAEWSELAFEMWQLKRGDWNRIH